MKFLKFLFIDAPKELRISVSMGWMATIFGQVYDFLMDDNALRLATALGAYGALVTMFLSWIWWIFRINKERRK